VLAFYTGKQIQVANNHRISTNSYQPLDRFPPLIKLIICFICEFRKEIIQLEFESNQQTNSDPINKIQEFNGKP
jgi:hypothetical protein